MRTARFAAAASAFGLAAALALAPSVATAICTDPAGDIDANGSTNVVDVQCAIVTSLWALGGSDPAQEPACLSAFEAADLNCDGASTVVDVQLTILLALGQPLGTAVDADGDLCVDSCQDVDPCGDGICDAAGGEDCLSCEADCGACPSCCEASTDPGCAGDLDCEACVCGGDPFCCENAWDGFCVADAQDTCFDACGCVAPPATCVETVNCEINCLGDAGCVAACEADADPAILADAIALFDCIEANGCLEAVGQEAFDQCIADFCADELLICIPPEQGDCCESTVLPGCTNTACQDCVCAIDPFCCDSAWDGTCVLEATADCGSDCGCAGLTCVGGVNCALGCAGDAACIATCVAATDEAEAAAADAFQACLYDNGCAAAPDQATFDQCLAEFCATEADACLPEPPDCCVATELLGCPGNAACETCVCTADPFCCDTSWDTLCANQAVADCATECGCGAAADDCCVATGTPGCAVDPTCEACVCGIDPFCCDTGWDAICVEEAAVECQADCGCTPPVEDCCDATTTPGCPEGPACETCVCAADPFCCETAWDEFCVGEAETGCSAECGCTATALTCVETVNCHIGCAGDVACGDACDLAADPAELAAATALFTCIEVNLCLETPDQAAFDACLAANCADETDACVGTPVATDCLDTTNCVLGCGADAACASACLAVAEPGAGDLATALVDCLAVNGCLAAPDQPTFDQCIADFCAVEADTCINGGGGAGTATCIETVNCALPCGPTDQACIDACLGDTLPAELPLAEALAACIFDNACHLTANQTEFNNCLTANCLGETQACLDGAPPAGSNCCASKSGVGCDDAACESCVCALDPFCCDSGWDAICANEAADECAADCPCP
jgi:hypothetical protein